MNTKIKIEFFHDVICSFCFPMSYRMRQIQALYPNVEIIHRSFALAPNDQAYTYMFGSRKAAKDEILSHWVHANQNDDLHRFNIEGMKTKDFLFPTSTPALLACKAAQQIGGEKAYWDLFDALQTGLFVENLNIEDLSIIKDKVKHLGLNLEQWQMFYDDKATLEKVNQDIALSQTYQIHSVPALVINGETKVNGAVSLERLKLIIDQQLELEDTQGASCHFNDGKIECD